MLVPPIFFEYPQLYPRSLLKYLFVWLKDFLIAILVIGSNRTNNMGRVTKPSLLFASTPRGQSLSAVSVSKPVGRDPHRVANLIPGGCEKLSGLKGK
jgi:hypothetical protein